MSEYVVHLAQRRYRGSQKCRRCGAELHSHLAAAHPGLKGWGTNAEIGVVGNLRDGRAMFRLPYVPAKYRDWQAVPCEAHS